MKRLWMLLLYLLGLAGFGGLSLKVNAPEAQQQAVTSAMQAIAEDKALAGQVDVQYDHLRAALFGRVKTEALRSRAVEVVRSAAPDTTSVKNHIRLISDLALPADKAALQKEMIIRFRALTFPPGRSDLGLSADQSLRIAATRIREVDAHMPLLLISRGHDDESVDLGLRRCRFIRKRMETFGVSPRNIGVICERREAAGRAGDGPQVFLLILE